MKIKDFEVGQIVYVVIPGLKKEFGISIGEVIKIGKKYITVKNYAWTTRFEEDPEISLYLVEHTACGKPRLLFLSREAIDEYHEHEKMKLWLQSAASLSKIDKYTLAYLRTDKKILEEGET